MSRDSLNDGDRAVSCGEREPFRRKGITHAKATVKHAGNREVAAVEREFREDSRRGLPRGMCLEVL